MLSKFRPGLDAECCWWWLGHDSCADADRNVTPADDVECGTRGCCLNREKVWRNVMCNLGKSENAKQFYIPLSVRSLKFILFKIHLSRRKNCKVLKSNIHFLASPPNPQVLSDIRPSPTARTCPVFLIFFFSAVHFLFVCSESVFVVDRRTSC